MYTIHFADFFDTYSQRITYEVPTRYRADTGKDSVKSSQNFLIFQNCSGCTYPLSSSIVHSSYRYCDDFAKDLPAISWPRGGIFHYFDFETDLPLSKTIAGRTSRYCDNLYNVLPAMVFFAAERPWFNLGAYWVVKPLKLVFCYLKGLGPLKNGIKFAGLLTN